MNAGRYILSQVLDQVRGYMDFARLGHIAAAGAFFATRAKHNLRFSRQRSQAVDYACRVRSDQIGKPTLAASRKAFPWPLRKVRYFDAETRRDLIFLTNHLDLPALTVAEIYRLRWQVELFFRWIKGHLRISSRPASRALNAALSTGAAQTGRASRGSTPSSTRTRDATTSRSRA